MLHVLALTSTLLFVLTYGPVYLPQPRIERAGPEFTAMTYNVFYRNQQIQDALDEIRLYDPDILGLQESVSRLSGPLQSELAEVYPYRRVESWCALLSKYEIIEYETLRLGQGQDLGLCSQRLVLDVQGIPVTVYNVHVRPSALAPLTALGRLLGLPPHLVNLGRDVDVNSLLSRVQDVQGPVLILDDFNMTDQHSAYAQVTRRLEDAFRQGGWGMGFTVNSLRLIDLAVGRVDYVFHSPDLVAVRAVVGDNGGSDHRPVIADLSFRQSSSAGLETGWLR